ncbi:MAG: dephospho-CoA kinase [Salinivirgaceae bacterium]|jgi:dephospho-CoA kinase|nr:dephospho-CoA kinase [Salinivirgaceae bacterium]
MQKIGVTGGIGSGKSLICKVFKIRYNIPIFEADKEAKKLINTDKSLKEEIIKLLGSSSYTPEGKYNTKFVASVVFNDTEKLKKLNTLVHRKVRVAFDSWAQQQNAPYVLQEAAILIESGGYKQLDEVIVVTAPESLRIKRVQQRDKMTKEQVLQRISKQLTDNERMAYAGFIIENNGTISILEQVEKIHLKITQNG